MEDKYAEYEELCKRLWNIIFNYLPKLFNQPSYEKSEEAKSSQREIKFLLKEMENFKIA